MREDLKQRIDNYIKSQTITKNNAWVIYGRAKSIVRSYQKSRRDFMEPEYLESMKYIADEIKI